MDRIKRIYVAGKLNDQSHDYIKNMYVMMQQAELIRKLGTSVYVPCIDILMGLMFGNYQYSDYFNNSREWLTCSDALYVCDNWETSDGTKREIEIANQMGIPVFFTIEELKAWLQ